MLLTVALLPSLFNDADVFDDVLSDQLRLPLPLAEKFTPLPSVIDVVDALIANFATVIVIESVFPRLSVTCTVAVRVLLLTVAEKLFGLTLILDPLVLLSDTFELLTLQLNGAVP